jgi:hypothetical protein
MTSAHLTREDAQSAASDQIAMPQVGDTQNAEDQIAYLADLIYELKCIAERARLGTLTRLLTLAHEEACRQAGSRS